MIQLLVKISIDEESPSLNLVIGEENSTASECEKEVFGMFKEAIEATACSIREAVENLNERD